MKLLFILTTLVSLSGIKICAQEKPCEIAMETIRGTYTGDCSGGKASGRGKSVGTDTYEGEFKNGYPDGTGTYTWQNQNYYAGSWKKGKMDGKGEMHYKRPVMDSIVKGFWKKDKYIGEYEKAYVVINNSSRVNKVDCRLTEKSGSDILITVRQISGSANINSSLPVAYVSTIVPVIGTFYTNNHQSLNNSSVSRIQQATFPFRAVFTLTNGESFEILFNEKGNYDVEVNIQ